MECGKENFSFLFQIGPQCPTCQNEEEGEILKGERREERREGLMGNYIWRLVAAGGKWTD